MKDGNFYQICGWMGNRLGLRGNDLICFAVIYGFSQDEESWFSGNLDYLTGCMFCSRPTTLLCLEHLQKLDLIRKHETMINGKKRCYYRATIAFEDGHIEYLTKEETSGKEPLPKTSKEPLPETGQEPLPKTSKEPLPNNNNIYNNRVDNNKKVENKFSTKKVFSKPTIQQVEEYIKEKKYHFDAEQFWNHYESVGWMIGKNHMKDWHCACATWEGRRKQEKQEQAKKENIAVNQGNMIDDAKWCGFQKWTFENVPKIHSLITSPMYREMVEITKNHSWVIADILTEINNEYYEGIDVMSEFNFFSQMDKYTQRINEDGHN